MIINGIDEIFAKLMGSSVGDSFLGHNGHDKTILVIYGIILMISIAFSIYAIILKIIKSRSNELDLKQSVITTTKYSLLNLVILVVMPIIIILVSMILDFISTNILEITINTSGIKTETIAQKLYWIGYLHDGFSSIAIPNNFGPRPTGTDANISYLRNFNFVVQVGCSMISMIMPLFLCWTFVQKYLEIFVFVSIMPMAVTTNFADDGARFKILLREVFSKFILILWCFIAFWLFKTLYYLMFGSLEKVSFNSRQTVALISVIAINFCLFSFTKLIGKSLNERTGIIGTYKSSKQTYILSKRNYKKQLIAF